VLSPRTYAPIIKKILDKYSSDAIHGMVHCGGAQTKILHFVENLHIIKDNLFPVPPLFQLIQEQSKTDWKEMYQVLIVVTVWKFTFLQQLHKILLPFQSHSGRCTNRGRVEAADGRN
jgi:phosphoribosylformylglycinamidine cyclo-ligase